MCQFLDRFRHKADRTGDDADHDKIDAAERTKQNDRREHAGPQRERIGRGALLAGKLDMVLLVGREIVERLHRGFDWFGRGGEAGQRFGSTAFGRELHDARRILAHLLPASLECLEVAFLFVVKFGCLERGGLDADDLLVSSDLRFSVSPLIFVCSEQVRTQAVLKVRHSNVDPVGRQCLGHVFGRDLDLRGTHAAHAPYHCANRGHHDEREQREHHGKLASDRSVLEIIHAERAHKAAGEMRASHAACLGYGMLLSGFVLPKVNPVPIG